MQRIAPAFMTAGQTTRSQLWGNGALVVPLNYESEKISDLADHTKGDTAHLAGRYLLALERGDVVLCKEDEARLHQDTVAYNNDLGISTLRPGDVKAMPSSGLLTPICADTVRLMERDPAAVGAIFNGARTMVPVIGSHDTVRLAERFGLRYEASADAVNMANNKKYLSQAAKDFGFLSPPTKKPTTLAQAEQYFSELMKIARDDPATFESKIWVKLCRSSGGEGVVAFTRMDKFMTWLNDDDAGKDFFAAMVSNEFNEGIVLQLGVKARAEDAAPNINFFVGGSQAEDRDLGASAQAIENGSIHVGNNGMLNEADRQKISPIIQKVAYWLRSIGFKGICGIDVIMGDNGQIWVIDCNARWNASTSTVMKFQDLRHMPGVGVFRYTGKIKVPHGLSVNDYVSWLDKQDIGFTPERGGVVPINYRGAHRTDGGESVLNAAIFGPNPDVVSEYFGLAQMR